jgi:putative intracellular protease/amidase
MKTKFLLSVAIAATSITLAPMAMADNILVVLSDKPQLELKEGMTYDTGFYLNELMEPVKRFIDEGHQVTFATPSGVAPTLDVNSDTVQYFANDEDAYKTHKTLMRELKITDEAHSPVISFSRVEQIGVGKFDAFFAPGGHAPMQDLLLNDQLGRILTAFHQADKPTGLVCHGPIALLSTLTNNDDFVALLKAGKKATPAKDWIYSGYNMTVFSNTEEEAAENAYLNGGKMYFYPENALKIAGGNYLSNNKDWAANVVVDSELITGQNPASANDVATEILKML